MQDQRHTESITPAHTTIKVTTAVRDRLKTQAAAGDRTLGEHLVHLGDLCDRQARFANLKSAIHATSTALMLSYGEETAAWDEIEDV